MTQFNSLLLKLLELLKDKSIKVQKALLDSLTYIAHLNSMNLRSQTAVIVSGVINFTHLRKDLIKTVDLGPLQHKIDEGEPLRKGAYVLIENMLSELSDKMDLPIIVERLVDGLGDDSDEVQAACQQILIKTCDLSAGSVLGPLDKLIDQIVKTVKKQLEKVKKQQDIDRATDSIRSFIRVILSMNKLPEIDLNRKFQDNLTDLLKDKIFSGLYEEMNKLIKL